MIEDGSLEDHLVVLKEIVANLEILDENYDEKKNLILIFFFASFRYMILYSRVNSHH